MKNKILVLICLILILNNINIFSENNKEKELIKIAYEAYEKQNDNKALNFVNKVLKINPNNIKALFIRSKIYFFKNKFNLALKDINLALENISKTNDDKIIKLKAPLIRDRAVIYNSSGKYKIALKDFLEVLKIYELNKISDFEIAVVYFDVALTYCNIKNNKESLNYLEKAIDYNPFELRYYDLGIYLLQNLNKKEKLNYYYERRSLLKKYSKVFSTKIKQHVYNISSDEYNSIDGFEKYYELKFKKNGEVQDSKFFPIIKVNDILEDKYFSDSFSEIMGNYMLVNNSFTDKKYKILALKIETFYYDSSVQDLHFIYKVKLESLHD